MDSDGYMKGFFIYDNRLLLQQADDMKKQKNIFAFLIPLQLNVKLFISNSTWGDTKITDDATKRKFWVKIIFALVSWKNQGDKGKMTILCEV